MLDYSCLPLNVGIKCVNLTRVTSLYGNCDNVSVSLSSHFVFSFLLRNTVSLLILLLRGLRIRLYMCNIYLMCYGLFGCTASINASRLVRIPILFKSGNRIQIQTKYKILMLLLHQNCMLILVVLLFSL